ncbi:HAMP domain-containing protein [Epibacterium sp. SM1979]|uniref:histidine kinase n=1 Tax=Tritonibacter litoralis TaxID=2662264 RepID=A0A843YNN7_9RHOB|nr:cache domain-containing protein [Tritonibacter litoralis]MQQ10237.1 HAMP domain-containing protein [Tritonibacter litoralis]
MRSVRLRLLILALLPLSVLIPLLLVLAMARWNADYDDVLIAKVESDLKIAEQYLARLEAETGNHLQNLAESASLHQELEASPQELRRFLAQRQSNLKLDFLYFLPQEQLSDETLKWPVISAAAVGLTEHAIDIFDPQELDALSRHLAERARLPLLATQAASPSARQIEDRGMVIHAAAPVQQGNHQGVLVGGILLNRNLDFIDTINALVYQDPNTSQGRQGTATLFLEDTRISTNVRLFEDVRALGTRVSAEVRNAVLGNGQTWLDRAFVVNDWYISGYEPLIDSFGTRVGMLYVGFLEAPYSAAKRAAYWSILGVFIVVMALSAPVFLWLAKGIFSPLERMTKTMRRVEQGNLSARIGLVSNRDEIGQVAQHLDMLLDQIQERDRRLRSWADELNARVDKRTEQLSDANAKLEETYKQLVMSEKLASIGEITAGVAHEINNPVAVIQGNVDVIRMVLAEQAGPIQTELDLVDNQVMRISAIVGKLLQFARPSEFGNFAESLDILPVVEDCLVLVAHKISTQEITVVKALGRAPEVRIDPGELQQVVINLIINAAQAMEGQGTLTLTLEEVQRNGISGAMLTVADTGPGIPADKLRTVFDPFYTTKLGSGTGLGLSISQTLIQKVGGIIQADNRETGGAVFSIWLPAAAAAEVAAQ